MTNAGASKGKAAVDVARAQGEQMVLLRLRVIRPWPAEAIRQALRDRRAVAVLDQNLAPGQGGILYQEVAACCHEAGRPQGVVLVHRWAWRSESLGRQLHRLSLSRRRQPPSPERASARCCCIMPRNIGR